MKIKFAFLPFLFISQSVLADMICDIDVDKYYAIYETDTYTCASGYYVPANTLGCVSCPTGFTCPGGTFEFNTDVYQGLSFVNVPDITMNNICAANFPGKLYLVYEPNVHNCSAGYYLPANVDTCTQCLAGNKCVGGTYTFNETTTQGIEQCSAGTFAPTGSAVCYDHILHIGNEFMYLRSTKLTTPSLNVAYGNNVYYANATTTPTPITAGSQHYLKVMFNNEIYYICDDTTYSE